MADEFIDEKSVKRTSLFHKSISARDQKRLRLARELGKMHGIKQVPRSRLGPSFLLLMGLKRDRWATSLGEEEEEERKSQQNSKQKCVRGTRSGITVLLWQAQYRLIDSTKRPHCVCCSGCSGCTERPYEMFSLLLLQVSTKLFPVLALNTETVYARGQNEAQKPRPV